MCCPTMEGAALWDALWVGDLWGHLAAWWALASGRVTAGTRYGLAPGNPTHLGVVLTGFAICAGGWQ